MTTAPNIETLVLLHGSHPSRDGGVCAMEAVAWLAGEPHSDAPECACPVLTKFVVSWNDAIRDDETRTRVLRPFLPRLIGTRSTHAVEMARSRLASDWFIREMLPAWLDLTPALKEHAGKVRALPPLLDTVTIRAAIPVIEEAGKAASAAGAAAWAAARAAARAAAGDAAWDAAWDAARAAARAAAGDAARAAAWDAAWDAARAAAGAAAWDAARAAAGDALQPTVARLQASVCDLLDRMIDVQEHAA